MEFFSGKISKRADFYATFSRENLIEMLKEKKALFLQGFLGFLLSLMVLMASIVLLFVHGSLYIFAVIIVTQITALLLSLFIPVYIEWRGIASVLKRRRK